MTLSLSNVHPINLSCSISSSSALEISHGSNTLSSYNNSIFNELPTSGANEDAAVAVADFTSGGQTHQVHVWEATAAGGVQKWTRETAGSRSSSHRCYGEVDVLIVAVPPGISVPNPTSTNGPPAPGTTQSTVKVKIRPQGGLPF